PAASTIPGASVPPADESASPSAEPSPTGEPSPPPSPTPSSTSQPTAQPTPPAPVGPAATLWILPGNGSGFLAPVPAWSGPLALGGTVAFAGDVDADSRADLIVQLDLATQPGGGAGIR